MRQYYFIDSKREQQGPFTLEELKEKGINKQTMVWYEGLENWTEASKVEELSFLLPPNPFQDVKEDAIKQTPINSTTPEKNSSNRRKPESWLAGSIIATILGCWPFGIPAIVYASKVDNLWNSGEYEEATRAAKNAKTWTLVAIFTAVGFWILYILFIVIIGITSGINQSSVDF